MEKNAILTFIGAQIRREIVFRKNILLALVVNINVPQIIFSWRVYKQQEEKEIVITLC